LSRRRRRGEEEQATDIKSNNPHLAGGGKNLGLGSYNVGTPKPHENINVR